MKLLEYVKVRQQRKRQRKARERYEREKARRDDGEDLERKMYGIANRGGGGMHGS